MGNYNGKKIDNAATAVLFLFLTLNLTPPHSRRTSFCNLQFEFSVINGQSKLCRYSYFGRVQDPPLRNLHCRRSFWRLMAPSG